MELFWYALGCTQTPKLDLFWSLATLTCFWASRWSPGMNLENFGDSFCSFGSTFGLLRGPIPCAKSSSKQAMPSENVCVRASMRVRLRRSVAVFVAAHESLVRSCVRVCACVCVCVSMYYAQMNVYDCVHNHLCTCACFLFLFWFVYVCVDLIWERL